MKTPFTIATVAADGGVGKTTLSVTPAYYLANQGYNVTLLDNDFVHAGATNWFLQQTTDFEGKSTLEKEQLEAKLTQHNSFTLAKGESYLDQVVLKHSYSSVKLIGALTVNEMESAIKLKFHTVK